jgi:hypothetical protein
MKIMEKMNKKGGNVDEDENRLFYEAVLNRKRHQTRITN